MLPLALPEGVVLLGLLPELPSTRLTPLVLLLELELLLVDFDLDGDCMPMPASAGDAVRVTLAPASTTAIVEIANILATLLMAGSASCDVRMIGAAGKAKCIPSYMLLARQNDCLWH